MTKFKQTVLYEYQFEAYTIQIVNMREGFAWYEFRIIWAGETLIESTLGCGQPAVAAREAFNWILDNEDTRIIPLLSDEDIRQMLDNEGAPEDEDKKS